MIFFLLVFIALIGYAFGSFSVKRICSKLVFRVNLNTLGKGNKLYSAFYRNYGYLGVLKVFAVELVADIIPVLLGGFLLKSYELQVVGYIFALFCVVMGKQWPFIHYFRGEIGCVAILVCAFCISVPAGIVVLVAIGISGFFSRYVSACTPAAAFAMLLLSYFLLDDLMVSKLCWCLLAVTLVKFVPHAANIGYGKEEKISFDHDISWKFERDF